MKYTIFIFAFTIFFAVGGIAQNVKVDSMIDWLAAHPKRDSQYLITLHKISYRLSEKDIKRSFAYYEKVVSTSDSMNYVYGKALAQINLGILLYAAANYDASNKAFFKAVDYAEACGAMRLKAISLNNIGDNLKTLKNFDKCRQYSKEAIGINTQLKAWRGVAINYELLQQCDLAEQLYSSAKNNLLAGLPFAIKANESYLFSQFYVGFGKLYAIDNNNDSAIFYFNKAIAQAKIQNDLRNEFQAYIAQATYLKNISNAQKIALLDTALNIAKQTSYLEDVASAALQLSNVYDELKDKDKSLDFYRVYRKAADSLFSENNKRNVIINESQWMIKRKEIENSHLTELAVLQHKDLAIKNGLLLAVAISLVLAIAIAFFIYKSTDAKKKRTEAGLKQKIAEIQMQVLRAQMNPHFIFNSLNSIENFMMQNEKRLASDYLNKFT
ncbi:MAG: histidine kinase, partial [Ferruginibacter sp.]|nr:histidine kinase [Ferruginibacter sp.]